MLPFCDYFADLSFVRAIVLFKARGHCEITISDLICFHIKTGKFARVHIQKIAFKKKSTT